MNKLVSTLANSAGLSEHWFGGVNVTVVATNSMAVLAYPHSVIVFNDGGDRVYYKSNAQELHNYLSVEWRIEEDYYA